jgi:hypothetical protein
MQTVSARGTLLSAVHCNRVVPALSSVAVAVPVVPVIVACDRGAMATSAAHFAISSLVGQGKNRINSG